MARRVLVLLFAVTAAPASVGQAQAQDVPDASSRPRFWETVAHPHALKVSRLLAEGGHMVELAGQYVESQQAVERQRLLGVALERFERAEKLDPKSVAAVRGVASTAFELGDFARAAEAYGDLVKLAPDERGASVPLAVALVKLRRYDDAVELLERALGGELGQQERGPYLATLGYAYMALGRLEDAIDAYDRAVKTQPYGNDVLALNGLAVAFDRDEQVGRAAEVLEQVRQLDPAFGNLAQPAVAGTPQIPFSPPSDRHYWLALAYEAQRRYPEAVIEWRAYVATGEPAYRRRAAEHLRAAEAQIGRKKTEPPPPAATSRRVPIVRRPAP